MRLEDLVARYPQIYHMAEAGTWPSIRARGLLSTSAALDQLHVEDARRALLEAEYRPTMASILPGDPEDIVLRDQRPMPPNRLIHALPPEITASDWYRLINGKVFFWARPDRLERLLNAYGEDEHDVLTVDTASMLAIHHANTLLCHMNSGNTKPIPHRRDGSIFKTIDAYPTKNSGAPLKEVVELVVNYSVPDIANHVIEVRRMKGAAVLRSI